MYVVYKITNLINSKIYIGKTDNLKKRWREHKWAAKTQNPHDYFYLHKAINKYGSRNFFIEIIEIFNSEKNALQQETFYIKLYNSRNKKVGYNLTDGGDGSSGFRHTKASKVKMSISKTKITPKIKTDILSNYIDKKSIKIFAEKYSVSKTTIRNVLTSNGIKLKLNQEDKKYIVNKYNSGSLIKDIAVEFKVSRVTISNILYSNGIKTQFRPTKDIKLKVINDYNSGLSITNLSKKYKSTRTTIRKLLNYSSGVL